MTVPKDNELQMLEDELRTPLSQLLTGTVSPYDTARLIRALQPAFDELKQASEEERFVNRNTVKAARPSIIRLVRSQLSSYSRMYWLASLLIFGMLLLLLPTSQGVSARSVGDIFSIVLPALLLASLAYSFRTWNKEMRMIETITPYPPALLLIVRTMIVISLNLVFGMIGSIYMNMKVESFPMLAFVLQWLSLLLLLSGITAYVLMWKGFKLAFTFAAAFWIGWNGLMLRILPALELSNSRYLAELQGSAVIAGLLLLALAYKRSYGTRLLP
ncbi:hypothetical protein [Paenibacillus spongiae]|uniref:Uncharacterized protein n=1 Tax=Paenibacillus spongiae TaxID=2909671 RepID=A0ABY5S5H7_9BACL|nr:hypothetical protein [Paenibacillus spongiae]UVI28733.1 hypothetical protein L1F29_25325 [Paenibacillus spongiae]